MPSRSIEQRITENKDKLKRLEAHAGKLEQLRKGADRKQDAHRKIVVGALFLKELDNPVGVSPAVIDLMKSWLAANTLRDTERALITELITAATARKAMP